MTEQSTFTSFSSSSSSNIYKQAWLRVDSEERDKEEVSMLMSYCPWMVKRYILESLLQAKKEQKERTATREQVWGVLAFVDISGFTPLTEALCRSNAAQGGELMWLVLTDFFTALLNLVEDCGGDVIKFAGDALLVFWECCPPIHSSVETKETDKAEDSHDSSVLLDEDKAVRLAVDFSLAASKMEWRWDWQAQHSYNFGSSESSSAGVTPEAEIVELLNLVLLRVKVAVTAGPFFAMHLGKGSRWEFLLSGEALVQVAEVEHDAITGTVVVSPYVWDVLQRDGEEAGEYVGTRLLPSGNVRVDEKRSKNVENEEAEQDEDKALKEAIRLEREKIKDELVQKERLIAVKEALLGYTPGVIRKSLELGLNAAFMADVRQSTILFISLCGINCTSDSCFPVLQDSLASTLDIIYHYKGNLRQFIVDDKGAVLIAVFGLSFSTLEYHAISAVHAAMAINLKLLALNVPNSIGVTTGRAFCGNIGSLSRCEYCIVGDCVNLSARLMGAAARHHNSLSLEDENGEKREKGAIFIDETTERAVREMGATFLLKRMEDILVKGKEKAVPVFTPSLGRRRMPRIDSADKDMIVGRENERALLKQLMAEYLDNRRFKIVYLYGESGMGKTVLLSELLSYFPTAIEVDVQATEVEQATPWFVFYQVFSQLFQHTTQQADMLEVFLDVLKKEPELLKYAPLLSAFMPVNLEENEETKQLTGEKRERMMITIISYVVQTVIDMTSLPIIIVIENCHWMDSSSWRGLAYILDTVKQLYSKGDHLANDCFVMLLGRPIPLRRQLRTRRSGADSSSSSSAAASTNDDQEDEEDDENEEQQEQLPHWQKVLAKDENATIIELRPMEEEEIYRLALVVSGCKRITPSQRNSLVSFSKGNPLIASILAKHLQRECRRKAAEQNERSKDNEEDNEGGEQSYRNEEEEEREEHSLPISLETAILSQLDSLPLPQQVLLRMASILAMRFHVDHAQELARRMGYLEQLFKQGITIKDELEELVRMDFLSRFGDSQELIYFVKNPFIQKTIYTTIPFTKRQLAHRMIAEWLEEKHGNTQLTYPLIAHHYDGARIPQKALFFYKKAAAAANKNNAFMEAIRAWKKALALEKEGQRHPWRMLTPSSPSSSSSSLSLHHDSSSSPSTASLSPSVSSPYDTEGTAKKSNEEQEKMSASAGKEETVGREAEEEEEDESWRIGSLEIMIGIAQQKTGNYREGVKSIKAGLKRLGRPYPESKASDGLLDILRANLLHHLYPKVFLGRRRGDRMLRLCYKAYLRLYFTGNVLAWDVDHFLLCNLQMINLAELLDDPNLMMDSYSYLVMELGGSTHQRFPPKRWGLGWRWVHRLYSRKVEHLLLHCQGSMSTRMQANGRLKLLNIRDSKTLPAALQAAEQGAQALAREGNAEGLDDMQAIHLNLLYAAGDTKKALTIAEELVERVIHKRGGFPLATAESALRLQSLLWLRVGKVEEARKVDREMKQRGMHKVSALARMSYYCRLAQACLLEERWDELELFFRKAMQLCSAGVVTQFRMFISLQLCFEQCYALWKHHHDRKNNDEEGATTKAEEFIRLADTLCDWLQQLSFEYAIQEWLWVAIGLTFAMRGDHFRAHRCWSRALGLMGDHCTKPFAKALLLQWTAVYPLPSSKLKEKGDDGGEDWRVRQVENAKTLFEEICSVYHVRQCEQFLARHNFGVL
ncbi:Guanylate cyclase domain-containing protein [Balamuthia mandrillaris]